MEKPTVACEFPAKFATYDNRFSFLPQISTRSTALSTADKVFVFFLMIWFCCDNTFTFSCNCISTLSVFNEMAKTVISFFWVQILVRLTRCLLVLLPYAAVWRHTSRDFIARLRRNRWCYESQTLEIPLSSSTRSKCTNFSCSNKNKRIACLKNLLNIWKLLVFLNLRGRNFYSLKNSVICDMKLKYFSLFLEKSNFS